MATKNESIKTAQKNLQPFLTVKTLLEYLLIMITYISLIIAVLLPYKLATCIIAAITSNIVYNAIQLFLDNTIENKKSKTEYLRIVKNKDLMLQDIRPGSEEEKNRNQDEREKILSTIQKYRKKLVRSKNINILLLKTISMLPTIFLITHILSIEVTLLVSSFFLAINLCLHFFVFKLMEEKLDLVLQEILATDIVKAKKVRIDKLYEIYEKDFSCFQKLIIPSPPAPK